MINNKYNLNEDVLTFKIHANNKEIEILSFKIHSITVLNLGVYYSSLPQDALYLETYCFKDFKSLVQFLSKYNKIEEIK